MNDPSRKVERCLAPLAARGKRGDWQLWALLAALPVCILGARLGVDLDPLPALGSGVAVWLPFFLLWWNRHAEREQARVDEALAAFEAAFPVKGVGRPQAIAAIATIAADPEHGYHHSANVLLVELGEDAPRGSSKPAAAGKPAGKFVLPDMEYKGTAAKSPAATPDAGPAPAGASEPVLPPELQQALAAQPPLAGSPPATPAPAAAPPAAAEPSPAPEFLALEPEPEPAPKPQPRPEPDRFDYIPLDPHEPEK